jgi:hypothetical protein
MPCANVESWYFFRRSLYPPRSLAPARLPFALQDRHHDEVRSGPVGQTVGLAQHAVAAQAQFQVRALGAGVVGKAVEREALGAHRHESLVKNEAQERRAQALAGAGDSDALEVEVGMRIAEAAQDGECLDRAGFPDAKPVGMGGRGQHRAMLLRLRPGDVKFEVRRAFDRHHGADIGERGRAQRKPGWVHDGWAALPTIEGRLVHCAWRRERLYPAVP